MNTTTRRSLGCWLTCVSLVTPAALARDDPAPGRRVEVLVTAEGLRVAGRVVGDPASGFRFVPERGGDALALERAREVVFDGPPVESAAGLPPFQVLLGQGQRVSGRLASVTADEVKFDEGPGRRPVVWKRAGVLAVRQRPGEVQVVREGFEALNPDRWATTGRPVVVDEPRFAGERSLRLPAGGTSLVARLAEPVGSGLLELAYFDPGTTAERQRWWVDLTFRDLEGDLQSLRALLGWAEETLSVEALNGPSLTVQPLTRTKGWHRLIVRFGPERTDLTVDGDELAHGEAPEGAPRGPLVEVRLVTQSSGAAPPLAGLAAHVDDLRLARFVEPAGRLEVDPSQDEVRLMTGDQLFGRIESADPDRVLMEVDGRDVSMSWTGVSGLYFRRGVTSSAWLDGLLVRLEWRPAPSAKPREADRVEGVLASVDDDAVTLVTPHAGTLVVPRDRLVRMVVLGPTRRLVLDVHPHHLGHRVDHDLDPPQPEGGLLVLPFTLDRVPEGTAFLALDVVKVVGESVPSEFAGPVKEGFLRTNVTINDKPIGYLNKYIITKNENPSRVRVPVPDGVLRAGANVLRLDQTGKRDEPEVLDNLGVLGIALEFDRAVPGEGGP